jgi:hypothetical protein
MGDGDCIKSVGVIHELPLLTIFSIKRITVKFLKGLQSNPLKNFTGFDLSAERCAISERL